MRRCPIERVALAPRFTLGVAVIRGQNVPVVDAGVLLTGEACSGARFVVLRMAERAAVERAGVERGRDERQVALAVDEVLGAERVEAGELGRLPPLLSGAAELVRSMAVLDGQLLEVLESARLIDAGATLPEPRTSAPRELS